MNEAFERLDTLKIMLRKDINHCFISSTYVDRFTEFILTFRFSYTFELKIYIKEDDLYLSLEALKTTILSRLKPELLTVYFN